MPYMNNNINYFPQTYLLYFISFYFSKRQQNMESIHNKPVFDNDIVAVAYLARFLPPPHPTSELSSFLRQEIFSFGRRTGAELVLIVGNKVT